MPPRDITGSRVVNRKPPKRVDRPAPVFGPIRRADQPIRTAQRQAQQRVRRAQAPILKRTNVPYVPKLAHPTPSQRAASINIVTRGLRRQRAGPDVQALARGRGSRAQQTAVNRYLGAQRAQQRQMQARTGALTAPRVKQTIRPPQAPFSFVDPLTRSAVPTLRYLPTGRDELVRAGRQVSRNLLAQGRPYAHQRAGIGPATIDLTATSQALTPAIASATAIPLALLKGGAGIVAHERLFSDKGVLGRTANDLLTYPAAAIPTAYQAVTHPGSLASGIVDQVTHPGETFKEHPLFGALLVHGGVSAVGRTAGAVGRATGADIAGTARSPLGLAGESGARTQLPRQYSKDIFRKAAQVAYDRRLDPVRDAQGNPVLDARGRPVLAAKPRQASRLQNQRADFLASRANAVERNTRAAVSHEVAAALPVRAHAGGTVGRVVGQAVDRSLMAQPGGRMRVLPRRFYRPEKDVVTMAMEGTLRGPGTFKADLLKERQRLEESYRSQDLNPLEKRTNRSRARTIDRVLKDPRALENAPAVFQSAAALARQGGRLSQQAVEAGILHPEAAARAKLFPYAQSHMGAEPVTHSDGRTTLRAQDGTFLSNEQIQSHMRENGVDPANIAYLPHRFDTRGARAYHQQFQLRRPNLDQESRTGSAYAKGATDTGTALATEHMVRQAGTLARQQEFDRLLRDVGVKHPSGRYFTWKEAQDYAKFGGRAPGEATNELLPGQPQLVPVRALPAKYDEARAQSIQGGQDVPVAADQHVHQMTDRFLGPDPRDPGAQNVVLVPKQVADRLQQNLRSTGSRGRGFQATTNLFRSTVLPFSVKWLTGNVAEGILRLATAGVSPTDIHVGRRLLRELLAHDATAAEQVHAHLVGGLLYGEKGLTNRRGAADVGQTAGAIAHAPVVRELGTTLKTLTQPSFIANRFFEQRLQEAALGKWSRQQIQDFTGSWTKAVTAQKQSLQEVAKGLTDTGAQHAAARYLDETLGKYSRFSPGMRHVIQTYAPFLPWYLNSVRFVMHTLPFKHPVKTAVLTQAEQAFEQDWKDQHKGIPAGLKTSIPSKGGYVDIARYTPFGALGPIAVGDLGQIPSIVLPQVSGPLLALRGLDPFGRPLKVPKTAGNPRGEAQGAQPAIAAVNQLAESFIPGLSIARRLREGGKAPYATSTVVSPQTKTPTAGDKRVSAANRIFNPVRPVYISPSRANSTGAAKLSPAQEAILRAHRRTQGSSSGGLTPAQEAVLRAYRRAHP